MKKKCYDKDISCYTKFIVNSIEIIKSYDFEKQCSMIKYILIYKQNFLD